MASNHIVLHVRVRWPWLFVVLTVLRLSSLAHRLLRVERE